MLQATATVELPPFHGRAHGPGRRKRCHEQHRLDPGFAARILHSRATKRRLARTSSRTDAQFQRVVYRKSYAGTDYGYPEFRPHYRYVPHHVLRESTRFFWVNTEEVSREAWTHAHPEALHTYRLDRAVLEAGQEYQMRRDWYYTWVLELPSTAVDEGTCWCDYIRRSSLPSGDTPPCLQALGLQVPCTLDDVIRAYRGLARKLHPDVGGSHEAFLALHQHYETALRLFV
jgi:hypothetical protein